MNVFGKFVITSWRFNETKHFQGKFHFSLPFIPYSRKTRLSPKYKKKKIPTKIFKFPMQLWCNFEKTLCNYIPDESLQVLIHQNYPIDISNNFNLNFAYLYFFTPLKRAHFFSFFCSHTKKIIDKKRLYNQEFI